MTRSFFGKGGNEVSRGAASRWRELFFWLLVGLALASALFLTVTALQRGVSFDGAMNLQVADSLAHGEGYRRSYGDQPLFPQEIETKLPFIFPAAVIFRIFGVGLASSQLTGVLYFVSFLCAVYWIVRRCLNERQHSWAWLAILLCMITPGIRNFGFNGYGELVALSWFLWGCFALFGYRTKPVRGWRLLGAGVLLGLAVATKVVLLIGITAAGLAFVGLRLASRPIRWRDLILDSLVLGSGIVLAQLPQEVMHFASEKTAGDFVDWWAYQFHAVAANAGMGNGMTDTPGRWAKLSAHFALVAHFLRLPKLELFLLFLSSLVLCVVALVRAEGKVIFRFLAVLGITVAIYFFWWLLITPTQKAWHRRIFDGILIFQLLLVLSAGFLFGRKQFNAKGARSGFALLAIVVVIIAELGFARDAVRSISWGSELTTASQQFDQVVGFLRGLGPEAQIFGMGWYSAPQLGLYSGRHILDFNHWPPARIRDPHHVYLAIDPPAVASGELTNILRRYQSRKLFPKSRTFQIYELDVTRENALFSDSRVRKSLESEVNFSEANYAALVGFKSETQAWRWMRCRGDALLVYRGQDFGYLKGAIPEFGHYRFPGGIHLEVKINDTVLAREHLTHRGTFSFRWPLAKEHLKSGDAVIFSIECDNVLMAPDLVQLSIIVNAFGFTNTSSRKYSLSGPREMRARPPFELAPGCIGVPSISAF